MINYDSGKRKFELKSFLTAKVAKKKNRKGRREKTGTENVIENKTISLTIKVNRQIYLPT
jgi:nucleoid DNA-binding protein